MSSPRHSAPRKSAPSLAKIQKLIWSAISNPLTDKQLMSSKLANGKLTTSVTDLLMSPNSRLSGFQRLEIYNRQYWFRLIDCLYDDFPGLRAVVGERRFYDLVVAYLTRYPSDTFALRDLGAKLPHFLQRNQVLLGPRKRAALDVVSFEWAQMIAFDCAALKPITPTMLSGKKLDRLRLTVQPYITLLELNYPFDDFVIALRHEASQRTEASTKIHIVTQRKVVTLPKPKRVYLAVHRFQNALYYKRLDKPAFVLLEALQRGLTLGNACKKALPTFPTAHTKNGKATMLIQEWFQSWTQLGWFGVLP